MQFLANSLFHPIDFSLLKNKNTIESEFLKHNGIIQKFVYQKNIVGFFVACKIKKEEIQKFEKNFSTDIIVATYIPRDFWYTSKHVNLYAKKSIYISGLRKIKYLLKAEKTINFNSFNSIIIENLSKNVLSEQKQNYINIINDRAKAFDKRLAKYYKSEKFFIF